MTLASPQPPGTTIGCAIAQGDPIIMAWSSTNTVGLLSMQNGQWQNVAGLYVASVVTANKGATLALDRSGHPYHWNVYAAYIGGQTTGSWTQGCPGPGNICNPNATHSGKLQVKFTSGHGINGTMQLETIPYNASMSVQSWDANPACDPIFGLATDAECLLESSGAETCNQSGANLGSPAQPPSKSYSEDFAQWDSTRNIGLPVQIGSYWYTHGTCGVNHDGTCQAGTSAVCQISSVNVNAIEPTAAESQTAASYECLKGPWSAVSVYVPGVLNSCEQVNIFKHAPIPGNCF